MMYTEFDRMEHGELVRLIELYELYISRKKDQLRGMGIEGVGLMGVREYYEMVMEEGDRLYEDEEE